MIPYAVFATHVAHSNNISSELENTAFISHEECKLLDKWQCVFLPTTSCTVPHVMSKCNTTKCVANIPGTYIRTTLFSIANATGELMAKGSNMSVEVYEQRKFFRTPFNALQKIMSKHLIAPKFSPPSEKSDYSFYSDGFMIRRNYEFRSKIAHSLHVFHKKNKITSDTRCVTVQMRRGDRTLAGINMTEFCYNATRPATPDNPHPQCQIAPGRFETCKVHLYDKGECVSVQVLGVFSGCDWSMIAHVLRILNMLYMFQQSGLISLCIYRL